MALLRICFFVCALAVVSGCSDFLQSAGISFSARPSEEFISASLDRLADERLALLKWKADEFFSEQSFLKVVDWERGPAVLSSRDEYEVTLHGVLQFTESYHDYLRSPESQNGNAYWAKKSFGVFEKGSVIRRTTTFSFIKSNDGWVVAPDQFAPQKIGSADEKSLLSRG